MPPAAAVYSRGGPNKGCSLVTVLGTEGAECSLGTSHVVTVSPLPQHAESKP